MNGSNERAVNDEVAAAEVGSAEKLRRNRWDRSLPWIGAFLGAAALVWVLRGFDLERFRNIIVKADVRLIAAVPVIVILEQIVRAWKWRLLLLPLRAIGSAYLLGAIMAGYLLAVLIPFGFGTVARSWLVARRENLKFTAVLATVFLDRLSDGIVFVCLVPIAVLATAFPDPNGGVRSGLAWSGAGSLVLFLFLVVGLELFRRQAANPGRLVRQFGGRLPPRIADPVRRVATSFAEGINWPHGVWRGVGVLLASLTMKLLASMQFLAAGLAFGVVLRPAEYLFVMVLLGFLTIIGHLLRLAGGFIIGAVFALGLLGVPEEESLAMALIVQASNFLTVAGLGAVALWVQGIALSDARNAHRSGVSHAAP